MTRRTRSKLTVLAIVLGSLALLDLTVVPNFKQFCGPAAVYRIGLGFYACEHNGEADPDFYCEGEFESLGVAPLFRDLSVEECGHFRAGRFIPAIERVVSVVCGSS